jgi:hypothetical protein
MANNSTVLRVNLIGDDRDLAKKLKQTEKRLLNMKSKLKSANKSFRGLFKGIGIAAAVTAFTQFSKAADQDNLSLARLTLAMNRLTGANEAQIKAMDAQIQTMQFATGIADDDLRNAYAKLLVPVKDNQAAFEALSVATDVAAYYGKDLDTVASAMSKALGGNNTALTKLIPGLKKVANPVKYLGEVFGGTAEVMADASPWKRIEVIFGDIAEKMGAAFLPLIEQFATWLTGPEGEKFLENLVKTVTLLATGIGQIVNVLAQFFGWLADIGFEYDVVANNIVANTLKVNRSINARMAEMKALNLAWVESTDVADDAAQKEKDRLAELLATVQDWGKAYREAVDLAFGFNESGNRFSAERLIRQMRKVYDYAKKLPGLLKQLGKGGATQETRDRIAALGPEQGYLVAQGLLGSGKLGEFNTLTAGLGKYGMQAGAAVGAATGYTININKANMTAEEIVAAIKAYERKSGRKLLF